MSAFENAKKFFTACEAPEGWAGCKQYVSIITTSCAVFGSISNRASTHDIVRCFDGIQGVAHEQVL
jgi:hypothetical protein